jgi:hypothetical protein
MKSNHEALGDQNGEIVVFSIVNPSNCLECVAELTNGIFLKMEKEDPLFAISLSPPNESNANLVMGNIRAS